LFAERHTLIIFGLPEYQPNPRAWKRFLKRKEKLLPQAKAFLPDIAGWLEKALKPIEALRFLERGSLFVADQLAGLVRAMPSEFDDQKQLSWTSRTD